MATKKRRQNNMASSASGDIDLHQGLKLEMLSRLYTQSLGSDVTFEFDDGTKLKAHRVILAAHSPVFASMLLDKAFESKEEVVKLPGKPSESFQVFLKFFYTHRLETSELAIDTIIDVLQMANEYQVSTLVEAICQRLQAVIDNENVYKIFQIGVFLGTGKLLEKCRQWLCFNSGKVLKNPNFLRLSKPAVIDIISQDTFGEQEIDILMAVCRWHEEHKEVDDASDILANIRFPFLKLHDGLAMAEGATLFQFLSAHGIKFNSQIGDQPAGNSKVVPRYFRPIENIATVENGTVIEGPDAANAGHVLEKRAEPICYMRMNNPIITIQLPRNCEVRSMAFNITGSLSSSTACDCGCAYTVETSVADRQTWTILFDCNDDICYDGRQVLMFDPKRFRYVRITGKELFIRRFGVTNFQCPAAVTEEDEARFAKECPNGGLLHFQAYNNVTTVVNSGSSLE